MMSSDYAVSPSCQEVTRTLDLGAGSLFDSLGDSDSPAIESLVAGEAQLSYKELKAFLLSPGSLPRRGIVKTEAVAVLIPNGPELALVLLACFAYTTAAPLDPAMTEAELIDAFEQLEVKHVIT